jgi:hypothetical protein
VCFGFILITKLVATGQLSLNFWNVFLEMEIYDFLNL